MYVLPPSLRRPLQPHPSPCPALMLPAPVPGSSSPAPSWGCEERGASKQPGADTGVLGGDWGVAQLHSRKLYLKLGVWGKLSLFCLKPGSELPESSISDPALLVTSFPGGWLL